MPSDARHLLIALLGRTPQVLTETLYALCVDAGIPISEVWAISTQEGMKAALDKLLDPRLGRFYQMQKDYPAQCGRVRFSAEQILVAHDGLLPLADIRSHQDSETFLELILRVLWEKTNDPNTAVHCSLAGGRKTMSTYMALVMQMLGREQDKLYHVLLTPAEAEHHAEFYYPAPVSQSLRLTDGREFDSAKVKVELVEIPYVRLRERLPVEVLERRASFAELLQWTQAEIAALPRAPVLQLIPKRRLLRIGGREIELPPIEFCLYWHFAERSQRRPPSIPREAYEQYFEKPEGSAFFRSASVKDLLAKYRALDGAAGMLKRFEDSLQRDKGLTLERLLQYISKINRKLDIALASVETAELYRISAVGRYGKCYGLKLDGRLIRVEE
ncbi:CRISPR-associated ring nuclease Csm6 [candidate division KSB1 bacterium]|nr:CRISPR-associated ring nuclease Csm6 [candidate division KSB1 bacterium]